MGPQTHVDAGMGGEIFPLSWLGSLGELEGTATAAMRMSGLICTGDMSFDTMSPQRTSASKRSAMMSVRSLLATTSTLMSGWSGGIDLGVGRLR